MTLRLNTLEHPKLSKREYQSRLPQLQLELMKLQHGIFQQKKRFVAVVEGIDAAGKGGMIRRMTAFMDPRGFRVHPIGAPTPEELKEHYLQRFWRRLPKQGQVSIFDRSWYGRVLVERVEGLIEQEVWQRAYEELNQFEEQLTNDGIILVKLFLTIEKDEQKARFQERIDTPRKRWKITPDDILTRQKWDEYQQAFEDMLNLTSHEGRAWNVISANNKRHARITCLETICDTLGEHVDRERIELLDPKVRELADQYLNEQA